MLAFAGARSIGNDSAVGDRGIAFVGHHGDIKDGLERRFVERGKGAPRIRGFKLRGGIVPKPGAGKIKATQFIVENSAVFNPNRGRPGGQGRRNRQRGLLFTAVESHGGFLRAVFLRNTCAREGDFGCVEDDGPAGLRETDADGFRTGEGRVLQIGSEGEIVTVGNGGDGQSLSVGDRRGEGKNQKRSEGPGKSIHGSPENGSPENRRPRAERQPGSRRPR